VIRSEQHKAFVRSLPCAVRNLDCDGPIEAAHVRMGSDGGTGMKPSDCYIVPLCHYHHNHEQHRLGERVFWKDKDPHELAAALWENSGVKVLAMKNVNRFRNGHADLHSTQ
jgi:hypothetical protein